MFSVGQFLETFPFLISEWSCLLETNSFWLLFHIITSPKHWCKCMSLRLCSSVMSWAPAGDHIPSAESFLSSRLSSSVMLNLSVIPLSCSDVVCTVCNVLALNFKHTRTDHEFILILLYIKWMNKSKIKLHTRKFIILKMHWSLSLLV